MKFVATKKGLTKKFFHPSLKLVFLYPGSGITDPPHWLLYVQELEVATKNFTIKAELLLEPDGAYLLQVTHKQDNLLCMYVLCGIGVTKNLFWHRAGWRSQCDAIREGWNPRRPSAQWFVHFSSCLFDLKWFKWDTSDSIVLWTYNLYGL